MSSDTRENKKVAFQDQQDDVESSSSSTSSPFVIELANGITAGPPPGPLVTTKLKATKRNSFTQEEEDSSEDAVVIELENERDAKDDAVVVDIESDSRLDLDNNNKIANPKQDEDYVVIEVENPNAIIDDSSPEPTIVPLKKPETDISSKEKDESKDPEASSSCSKDEHAESCPICLNPTNDFVQGPCKHPLCIECMELLLNANSQVERWPPPAAADCHLSAPTLGRCPICRAPISLFEIVHTKDQKPLYPLDLTSWKAEIDTNQDEKTEEQEQPSTAKEFVDHTISQLSQTISSSLTLSSPKKHPLLNAVYMPYRGRPGEMSFHWDWSCLKARSAECKLIERPFMNLTRAIRDSPGFWRLDDQTWPCPIQYFEEGCHFHEASRTFHATILWPIPIKGSYEWDIILGFSKDYRFISSGRIHHKRGRKLTPNCLPKHYTEKERELCKHPLDGRWTFLWKAPNGEDRSTELHVINNEFKQSGWSFYLNFTDPNNVVVNWPRSKHKQTIVRGLDLINKPMGPEVGQKIYWETSDPNAPDLVWVRQTIGPNPVEYVHNYGMGQGKFLYHRRDAKVGDAIPKYNPNSVFGNVFTKRMYLGSASYHFVSPTESYISYRHPACRDLPSMDDGSPLPTRVNFQNLKWDKEERKLTANVEWEKDFGTSWNDNVRWKLNMYFDSEYMVILKGGIQCEWCKERRARPHPPRAPPRNRPAPVPIYVPPNEDDDDDSGEDPQRPPPQPDRNEEWVVSGYGHDQLYVNAACLERYKPPQRSHGNNEDNDENDEEHPKVDYRGICEQHQKRLEQEGATKRTIGFLTHLFQLGYHDDENPIDFLI